MKNLIRDMMEEKDELLYILKHGHPPQIRLESRRCSDKEREPGERFYVQYVVTNKPEVNQ